MKREETMKLWNLQHRTTDDVRYLVVSATQNCGSTFCTLKENTLTPSLKVCADQREYGSNMLSKKTTIDFVDAIKDEDHVSM